MSSVKILLLLCYEFPPYPSIGGRRWAKFSKYLVRQNYKIKVVAAKNPSVTNTEANWRKDIVDPNIQVHYLESHYPYTVLQSSNSFLNRMIRKGYSKFLEFQGKGIVQDKAIFWEKDVLQLAQQLIEKHQIKNVISTGPPHRLNYYAAKLKEKSPDLNVICDFRDSWLDGKVYGLKGLSERVRKVEARMESYTVQQADHLLFTYQPMLADFTRRYPAGKNKFVHFPHNFDPDDYPANLSTKSKPDSIIRFIYGGSVTSTAVQNAFIPFLQALQKLKDTDGGLWHRLEVIIYGEHIALNNAIKVLGLSDKVTMKDKIPEECFYKEAANSSFLLSFLGNDWKEYITTKHIAYLPIQKPILLIAQEGLVTDFIEKNRIGYVISPERAFDSLILLLKNYEKQAPALQLKLDIDSFSYEKATQKLIPLLK